MEGIPEVVMVGGLGVYRREGNVKGTAGAGCCLGIVPEFIHRVFLKGMVGVGREREGEGEREKRRGDRWGAGGRNGETKRKTKEVSLSKKIMKLTQKLYHTYCLFSAWYFGVCALQSPYYPQAPPSCNLRGSTWGNTETLGLLQLSIIVSFHFLVMSWE